jgi:peptidoglycan/LPS O-acetylase OafA/YrhL
MEASSLALEPGAFVDASLGTRHSTQAVCFPNDLTPTDGLLLACGSMSVAVLLGLVVATYVRWRAATPSPVADAVSSSGGDRRPPAASTVVLALDGLKVVCIFLVILLHHGLFPSTQMQMAIKESMTFFIVASGFLRLGSASRVCDWAAYIKYALRSLVRLVPAYYLAVTFTLIMYYKIQGTVSVVFAFQAIFVQSFFPIDVCEHPHYEESFLPFQGLTQGWFVSVVVWCSLCAPLLTRLRPRLVPAWSLLVAFTCASVVVESTTPWIVHYVFIPARLLQFACGMLCAEIVQIVLSTEKTWPGWAWVFDASLLVRVVLALTPVSSGVTLVSLAYYTMGHMMWCLVIVSAGLASATKDRSINYQGILFRMFAAWPLEHLAQYSYGAYIYQFLPAFVIKYV